MANRYGRPSTFKVESLARELHELLDIPLQRYGKGGSGDWYEPTKGRQIIQAIAQVLREALLRGETVWIRGFGRFEVRTRAPRKRKFFVYTGGKTTNLVQLKQNVDYPAKRYVVFIPSPYLSAITNTTRGFQPRRSDRRALINWKSPNANSNSRKTPSHCK